MLAGNNLNYMKKCCKCAIYKEYYCFNSNKTYSSGLHPTCRECRKSERNVKSKNVGDRVAKYPKA